MKEIEEKRKEEAMEPRQAPAGVVNGEPQDNPIREIYDLMEMDDEEAATPDDWRSQLEEKVNILEAAKAEQNALLKSQGEQLTRVVNVVDMVISWMDRESQASHQPSPAVPVASQNKPQQIPDDNLAGTSKKRKPTANHPPSALPATSITKRTGLDKQSGSPKSQKKN